MTTDQINAIVVMVGFAGFVSVIGVLIHGWVVWDEDAHDRGDR